MKKLIRILLMPIGLIKGVIDMMNNNARDIENRLRFSNAIIDPGSTFSPTSNIGLRARILGGCIVNNTQIGMFSYLNRNVMIQNAFIGNYCSIANNVMIGLGAHPIELFSTSPIFYKVKNAFKESLVDRDYQFQEYKQIQIGHDVWIGASVIVMDGVNIGHGAVVASGAIVTKDVPPYAIVAGVPAKVLKYRFSESKISALLETEWWLKEAKEVLRNKGELDIIINN